ncbi:MAG: hypothetical protein M3178_10720 [Pseudomonadota bacterium]|nr:hypothetical protein [Pseudomonadota bacterium]
MTSIHGARAEDAQVVGQATGEQATTIELRSAPARPSVSMPLNFNFNRPTPTKGAAQGGPAPSRPNAPAGPGSALSLYLQAASVNENTGGGFPPDGDIATSQGFTVQVNNFVLTMYDLNSGALAKQVNLATFFGDGTSFIFDPRVIFDPVWQRFVVMADACNPCSGPATNSFVKLAISSTSNPTGGYIIYSFNAGTTAGDFLDFPQMGMDLNSIIITYNDFRGNGGFDARTFAVAKAYLYNGFGFGVPVFGGSGCTVAPPYVLDNGGPSYTLVACPGDNKVYLGPMFNTGLSNVSLTHWQALVPTAAFGTPPCAPQPGVSYCLETGDSRFENRSAQIGNRIWNVNVIQIGTTATPRWYEFNTGNNTLVNSGIWFATGPSSDWHPSIVVNAVGATGTSPTGETFGTWMSVDATNNLNLQLRAIGGSFDNAGTGAGIAVGPASAQPLTNQTLNGRNRSGDYSYISLYPAPVGSCAANEFAILEGEVSLGTIWGTRVGIVKHC